MAKIEVKGTAIRGVTIQEEDYISLTDMLKAKAGRYGGTYAHKANSCLPQGIDEFSIAFNRS